MWCHEHSDIVMVMSNLMAMTMFLMTTVPTPTVKATYLCSGDLRHVEDADHGLYGDGEMQNYS